MADQIEEVKQKTDIVALIGERIELKKAGRNYKALCPFHGEKTPSFMVSPELQIYKCFGCSQGGDVFAFLKEYEGMEFGEALRFLAEKAGVKLIRTFGPEHSEKEKIIEINNLTGKFYQYFLLSHSLGREPLRYLLKDRGLKLTTVKEFQLGFSPDNPLALKKFLIDKKRFTPSEVEGAGIGYPKGGYFIDRLRGRVIFPLFDHRGNTVGFAGRLLPSAKDQEMAKYINTPETPAYHKGSLLYALDKTRQEIKKKETAVVVEGELDAISSWQVGIKNVVAIKGSALTEDQVRLLSRFAKQAVLCLDADIAGDAAARKAVMIAQEQGLEVKVARLEGYKDPDDVARGNPKAYQKFLETAVGIWDFLIDSVFERFDAQTGEGKAKISREVVPILSLITDKIVQAHYIGLVAKKLGVSEEAVSAEINQRETKGELPKKETKLFKEKETKGRRELLEERLLSLGFRYDHHLLDRKSTMAMVRTPLASRILEQYRFFLSKHKTFSVSAFSRELPPELFEGFSRLVLTEDHELEKPENAPLEAAIVEYSLKVLEIKEKLTRLSGEIKETEERAEESKEKKTLSRLKNEFRDLSEKLHRLEEESGRGIIAEGEEKSD